MYTKKKYNNKIIAYRGSGKGENDSTKEQTYQENRSNHHVQGQESSQIPPSADNMQTLVPSRYSFNESSS